MQKSRRLPCYAAASLAVVLFSSATCIQIWSAAAALQSAPSTQGRPLTPAGVLIKDLWTNQPAVGALTADFVRSPDKTGPDGAGRYLIAINSGFGIQFNSSTSRGQQSLAVIDLSLAQAAVVQNVYFPTPQSANVGAAFARKPDGDGSYTFYVSGGVENKVWIFRFKPGDPAPLTPASPGPATRVEAPFVDLSGFSRTAPTTRYNDGYAPVYPAGIALGADDNALFVANNLGDSLGIITDLRGERGLTRVDLARAGRSEFVYPYGVVALSSGGSSKVYVSCWNDSSIAVINSQRPGDPIARIQVDRHPTAMKVSADGSRLYVVNSNADTVSVINTKTDQRIETINVKLAESARIGSSPEGLALSADGSTLYVSNAHSNAVAVVSLSDASSGRAGNERRDSRSRVRGFIPTGLYPSALAIVGRKLFVANGKGTGFASSSIAVNDSGLNPNAPNDRFPGGTGRAGGMGGQYILSLISGNMTMLDEPDERQLAGYTEQVMRNNGLVGERRDRLFDGPSPIKHVIYVIKENRTYDQVFGDLERSGNGQKADGDPSLAIFGAGDAAASRLGNWQNITPNQRALALRFGLFDRFFVNAEASPDGHNWSTAAFSNDYVDKTYRWSYSNRGRTYDYEGFNRLPTYEPRRDAPPMFDGPVGAEQIIAFMRRFAPDLKGSRDAAEPETLYLWDAAAKAGLTYRNYGEFVATLSKADVEEVNNNKAKEYPDLTPTVQSFPTKRSLEGHFSPTYRNFDQNTPDSMTTTSYKIAKTSAARVDPVIGNSNPDERLRGYSRLADWLAEFRGYVADLQAGRPDRLPNLSIVRFPNNHTAGLRADVPTPQFYVAENDYAVGRLVEAVSNSPYWKDTAILIVEDDAQDGPDHIDAHRSPVFVISAYNRPGLLIHEFHNTVSLIRTMELLLGMAPMNQLDATAVPMDLFHSQADLRPFTAVLPDVDLENLVVRQIPRDGRLSYWMNRTAEQNMEHADMADPRTLNEIIWYSVRGQSPMPSIARLPAFDAMKAGLVDSDDGDDDHDDKDNDRQPKIARRIER